MPYLSIRFTPDEKKLIKEYAQKANRPTVSDYVRHLIFLDRRRLKKIESARLLKQGGCP